MYVCVHACVHGLARVNFILLLLGFFSSDESDLRESFMSASNSLREDFRFGHTQSPDVLAEYKYSE